MKQINDPNNIDDKHQLSAACFNTCIEWKLSASVGDNKNTYEYIFSGKSLFFKKLEGSILNTLQNKFGGDTHSIKNCLKEYKEKSNADLDKHGNEISSNEKEHNFLNLKIPIDNTKFNFMIIDANLSLTENLNNIFFLEFDLSKSSINKEKLRMIREINNDCVEREIFFVLNGTLHGTNIFKTEINFSVETRKFIKSMQFRLEQYKYEFNRRYRFNKDENKQMKLRNYFYTKVLSNTNIGIEFFKPTFEPSRDKFPSNFNSIVNSNILLNKIYLEVSIPKIFFDSGLNLSMPHNMKETELDNINTQIGEIDLNNKTYVNLVETALPIENKPVIVNTNNIEINKSESETNSAISEKIYRPQVIHNKKFFCSKPNSPVGELYRNGHNINMNMNIPPTIRSPDFFRKNISLNSFNNGMFTNHIPSNQQEGYSSVSSSNLSIPENLIPNNFYNNLNNHTNNSANNIHYMTPSIPLNRHSLNYPQMRNNSNNRKMSEQVFNKLKENPLKIMNMNMNQMHGCNNMNMSHIRSPNMYMKVNQDLIIPTEGTTRNMRNFNTPSLNFSNFNHMGSNMSSFSQNFNLSSPPNEMNIIEGVNQNSSMPYNEYSGIIRNDFSNLSSFNQMNFNQFPINPINNKFNHYEGKRSYDFKSIDGSNFAILNGFTQNIHPNMTSNFQSNMPNINNNRKNSYKLKNNLNLNFSNLKHRYEGMCNFSIFIRACTPNILKSEINTIKEVTLADFFLNFEKVSIFGLDLYYNHENEMINLVYSPTISSFEIFINPTSNVFQQIIKHELTKVKHLTEEKEKILNKILEKYHIENPNGLEPLSISEEIINYSYERYLTDGNNHKLIIKYDSIKFEFFEIRPPHSRQILITQIQNLLESFELLGKIKLSEINNDSLFSILYTPFKSTKGLMMNTSFLVYHSLNIEENNLTLNSSKNFFNSIVNKNFVEVPIIGILPIKLENKTFLTTITGNKTFNSMNTINMNIHFQVISQTNSNTNSNNINNNLLLVKNLIENVNNNITTTCKKNSADYEYYLKNFNYSF